MSSPILTDPCQVPPAPVHRFTVEQYHRMIETGVLTAQDRVELLEGWILPKRLHHPPHDGTLLLAQTQLLQRLPNSHVLRIQSAITLAESEPEPDLVVARGPERRYLEEHPGPRDIALLVEVADTTLDHDRGIKQRVYAWARIRTYWIINVNDGQVEVYMMPRAGKRPGYRQRQDYRRTESVPVVIEGEESGWIPVRELLP
jgi:Uma2 family endonuclease